MKDKSKLEIDTEDIQRHFNGKSVNFADIESFVTGHVVNDKPSNQQSIINGQGFYIPQYEYIEYQIAKREAIKKSLRRRKIGSSLWFAFLWLLKTMFAITLTCLICWGFYMLCWLIQQTF